MDSDDFMGFIIVGIILAIFILGGFLIYSDIEKTNINKENKEDLLELYEEDLEIGLSKVKLDEILEEFEDSNRYLKVKEKIMVSEKRDGKEYEEVKYKLTFENFKHSILTKLNINSEHEFIIGYTEGKTTKIGDLEP